MLPIPRLKIIPLPKIGVPRWKHRLYASTRSARAPDAHASFFLLESTYLPTYLPTYPPTYVRTYVRAYVRECGCTDAHTLHVSRWPWVTHDGASVRVSERRENHRGRKERRPKLKETRGGVGGKGQPKEREREIDRDIDRRGMKRDVWRGGRDDFTARGA